jgi:cell division septation protein DedD
MGTQDTEITLGTGKMLGVFFALVALCGVFFGLGYSLGRGSGRTFLADGEQVQTSSSPALRPSAMKSSTGAPAQTGEGLTFYKAVEQKDPNAQLATDPAKDASKEPPKETAKEVTHDPADADPKQSQLAAPDPATALASTGYFVQVAAVSKQDDAQALVDALKKKQYAAFTAASAATDKLFRVQIGPFNDIKEAEATRAKLISDGYNPILKK